QRPIEGPPFGLREAGPSSRPPGGGQPPGPALAPRFVPAAHTGARDTKGSHHLGLGLATLEHPAGPHPHPLHLLEIPRGHALASEPGSSRPEPKAWRYWLFSHARPPCDLLTRSTAM